MKMMLMFCLFLLFRGISAFNEDVFKAGASGKEVVDHVVDLVGQTCLIDNEIFLKRMADVETQYGNDGNTYRDGYNGGIWNIGEDLFNLTKNNPSLFNEYQDIKTNLNIDWSNVTWSDLRKPIYSGLAASLLLLSKQIRTVPGSVELQATVWSVLRPGSQPFSFFIKAQNAPSECDPNKVLDVAIILDFQKLSALDLTRVESFIRSMLSKLPVANDNARVSIVTKKLQPIAAWYLNSARPGLTLSTALKILRYAPGPATTGDSINYTNANMFTPTNGARAGSARVAVLLTDTVTQSANAEKEAKKLEDNGVSLVVVKIQRNDSSLADDGYKNLASSPQCRNTRKVDGFNKLEGVVNTVTKVICQAPVKLKAGDYVYPCSSPVLAELPDSTESTSVMVSTTNGNVSFYASNKYSNPDQSAFDIHLVPGPNEKNTPVLYVRGTNPVYITVPANTCTGNFTIHVKQKDDVFTGMSGVCLVAGTIRKCTDLEMGFISHDVVLLSGQNVPNLCDPNNHKMEYFPHPVDQRKFIMCDQHDQAFVGLCPIGQSKCVQITSGCKYSNPCSRDALLGGKMYHNDPCGNQTNFIKCTHFGVAQHSVCGRDSIWNEDSNFCVSRYVRDRMAVGSPSMKNIDNPCIHEHSDHVYFPFPGDTSYYIFCDIHGNGFRLKCRNGHWNQQTKTCTTVSPPDIVG